MRIKDFVAVALLVVLGLARLMPTPAPKAIEVKPYTESDINRWIEDEHRERHIKRAIASVRVLYRVVGCRDTYSEITGRTAYEYGLPPRLLAAVVFVESSCRAGAASSRNSVGLMQINPRVWGHAKELRDPVQNLRFGARILKMYISRYGLVEGLHHYNGLGNKENTYANHVLEVMHGEKQSD